MFYTYSSGSDGRALAVFCGNLLFATREGSWNPKQ